MADNTQTLASSSIKFGDLLLLVFIVLKLTHVIMWSWWWVFAPVWIPVGILLAIYIPIAILSVWSWVQAEWVLRRIKRQAAAKAVREGN